ncbi:hypothetical protein ACFRMQ_35170 [Kitasatospora sp. NPDC056783]|uniref:hypothetical protein n=1 Tax=Kitasatospora sp. NPDC056783 TaxID=3345943 RepID=UPI0036C7396B
MYPTAPPKRPGVRVWRVLLRIVLVLVPLLSLGMLGWVALLWLAVEHRRTRDWLAFAAAGATGVGGLALVGPDGGTHTTAGMVLLLGTALAVPAYYLAVELGPRPEAAPLPSQPHPYPPVPGYAPAPVVRHLSPVRDPSPVRYPPVQAPPPVGHPPAVPPVFRPVPARPDRIGEVRAGLDELSAYLEREDHR